MAMKTAYELQLEARINEIDFALDWEEQLPVDLASNLILRRVMYREQIEDLKKGDDR